MFLSQCWKENRHVIFRWHINNVRGRKGIFVLCWLCIYSISRGLEIMNWFFPFPVSVCTWSFTFPVFRVICTHLYPHRRSSESKKMKMVVSIISELVSHRNPHVILLLTGYPQIRLRQEGAGSRASPNSDAKRWRPRRHFFKKQGHWGV